MSLDLRVLKTKINYWFPIQIQNFVLRSVAVSYPEEKNEPHRALQQGSVASADPFLCLKHDGTKLWKAWAQRWSPRSERVFRSHRWSLWHSFQTHIKWNLLVERPSWGMRTLPSAYIVRRPSRQSIPSSRLLHSIFNSALKSMRSSSLTSWNSMAGLGIVSINVTDTSKPQRSDWWLKRHAWRIWRSCVSDISSICSTAG